MSILTEDPPDIIIKNLEHETKEGSYMNMIVK